MSRLGLQSLAVVGEVFEGVFAGCWAGETVVVGPVGGCGFEGDDVEDFAVLDWEGEHVASWAHLEDNNCQ